MLKLIAFRGKILEDIAIKKIAGEIEALLFISDSGLSLEELSSALNTQEEQIKRGIDYVKKMLELRNSALEIREVAGGFALFTRPVHYETIEKFLIDKDKRKLSGPGVETLAIIAYTQPVTRVQVSDIRGVNSDSLIATLINKGYVAEVGVAESAGNPSLFGTTQEFLDRYDLKSIDGLPDLASFAPNEEVRLAIAERLGNIRSFNNEGENSH